jgi:hypothetical protein
MVVFNYNMLIGAYVRALRNKVLLTVLAAYEILLRARIEVATVHSATIVVARVIGPIAFSLHVNVAEPQTN